MHWLFGALGGIAFVELFLRLPLLPTLSRFQGIVSRIMSVMSSKRISDHWKEKVLPRYALQMFRSTLMIAVYLVVTFIPFLVLLALASALQVPLLAFSVSWVGIVFITVVALAYLKIRALYVTPKV